MTSLILIRTLPISILPILGAWAVTSQPTDIRPEMSMAVAGLMSVATALLIGVVLLIQKHQQPAPKRS